MTTLLKTDFSDASIEPTNDPQWDKLVLPAGKIPIMYEAGTLEDRSSRVIDSNLEFMVRYAKIPGDREGYYKGRVQLNCAMPDVGSITMRSRMLLDLEAYRSFPKANGWFTIIELWAGAASSRHPFRISLNLAKDFGAGTPIFFSVSGSQRDLSGRWLTIWSRSNRADRPPLGELFDLEMSCLRGDYQSGEFQLNMNGGALFDITNWTYHRSARAPIPFSMIQPCKLYTSGAVIDHMRDAGQPARILWDSLEIST